MSMNKWKIVKKDDETFEIQKPPEPEITIEIVVALIVIFLFCFKRTAILNFLNSIF